MKWDRDHKIFGGHRLTKLEPGHWVKEFGDTKYYFTRFDREWTVDVFDSGGQPRVSCEGFSTLTDAVGWAFERFQRESSGNL